MLRTYNTVRTEWLRYQEYLEHPDWEVNLVRWRLRTGIAAVEENIGRRTRVAWDDRTCPCVGCAHAQQVETTQHMVLVCDHWAARREALVNSVMANRRLSPDIKGALGSVYANPDMWWRFLMCAPLPELGSEYVVPLAVLAKRISSRQWCHDVTPDEVARAQRALNDRMTAVWVTGRQLRAWYLDRAVLAGYTRV